MARAARLVTHVDLAGDAATGRLSASARLEAVLDDGRRLTLLDDRGWAETQHGGGDVWATSDDAIAATARTVVGPDEPPPGRSHEEEERLHWEALAERLRGHGVAAGAAELARLPHDVELSERLRARIGGAS